LFITSDALIAQAADPAPRGTWEVIRSGESDFGSIQTVFEPLPVGEERIVRHTRYLVDLFGLRQEVMERHEFVVSATKAPIACRCESQGPAGLSTAEGKVDGQQLRVSIVRGTTTLQRTIELKENAIFDVCLPEYLAGQPQEVQKAHIAVIDSDAWKLELIDAERIASENGEIKWKVSDSEWTFGAAGVREVSATPMMGRTTRRATAEQAAAIDYLKYSPRELLTFPVQRSMPFPERAAKIVVRLAWQDFPLKSMNLEDSRQRIVAQEDNEGRCRVDLALTQPAVIETAPAIPMRDPAFAAYLADDDYIQPSDPAIAAQAKEWTAGATTSLDAVRALSRHVAEYLQGGEMIAETLSGPEVLACRKGKCSEFTTLLASLTRSVGVPTRVALGMRLVGGQWIGHMWCEAWVGQWIPVDATAAEVGGSPALLKLTHGSSVEETQQVRWAMTRSLEVDVIGYEAGTRADLGLTTGIVRQTYTNADFACRITAPDGWSWHDESTPGTAVVQCKVPEAANGKDDALVHFVAFALPTTMEASVLVKTRKSRFESMYQGFKVVVDEPQAVGAAAGRRFCFERQDPGNAEKIIKTTEILWTVDRSGYIVNLVAEASRHDALLAQFNALTASFESLASTAQAK
jgi:hypothetical protein